MLERQSAALAGLDPARLARRVRAGLGDRDRRKTATPAQAQEAHAALRRRAGELLGEPRPRPRLRILYGGSVKPDNAAVAARARRTWTAPWSAGQALTWKGFAAIIHAAPGERRGA